MGGISHRQEVISNTAGSNLMNGANSFVQVLSKPHFDNTKHQQEILGGDNPNEDTESEWNRNNSSMLAYGTR